MLVGMMSFFPDELSLVCKIQKKGLGDLLRAQLSGQLCISL